MERSVIVAKNGSRENIVELWGHEFNVARNGLDEAQVVPFVDELISERDLLFQRVEHLSTLTKLAEKTIVEADRLAEDIKKEAVAEAKTEAKAILAKADEQAQQLVEEKQTEIITAATEEAESIKADAEREAEFFIAQQREKIQPEIRNVAQQLYGELLSQIEGLMQQVKASEVEFEHKLSQPLEQASAVQIEEEPSPTQTPVDLPQESGNLNDSSALSLEPAEDIPEEKILPVDNPDKPAYDKEIELEILPPLDIKQIMGIMSYLDSLAEVENTELIPLTDKPLIIVSLHEPVHLIELLRALPEVEEVKEVIDEEVTHAEGQRRKIQIVLSRNSILDGAKEKLNMGCPHF